MDAATGQQLWKFDSVDKADGALGVNRGVTYWEEGEDKRILYSFGQHLYALDARTGKKIESFGMEGQVSLKEGLGERAANLMVVSNTPGVIYKNLIIMGSESMKDPLPHPGISVPTKLRPESLPGSFIPYHIRENLGTTPGRKMPGQE